MPSPAIGTEDLRMTENGTCPQWSGMATAEEVGSMLSGYLLPSPPGHPEFCLIYFPKAQTQGPGALQNLAFLNEVLICP